MDGANHDILSSYLADVQNPHTCKKSCTTWDERNRVNNGVIYQTQLVRPDVFHQQNSKPCKHQGFSGKRCRFLVQAPWRKVIHPTSWGWYLNPYLFWGCFIWTLVNPMLNPCIEAIFSWELRQKNTQNTDPNDTHESQQQHEALNHLFCIRIGPGKQRCLDSLIGVKEFFAGFVGYFCHLPKRTHISSSERNWLGSLLSFLRTGANFRSKVPNGSGFLSSIKPSFFHCLMYASHVLTERFELKIHAANDLYIYTKLLENLVSHWKRNKVSKSTGA